jgi:hypothetical protein
VIPPLSTGLGLCSIEHNLSARVGWGWRKSYQGADDKIMNKKLDLHLFS